MTRTHRKIHRVLWPVLAVLVTLGVAMALVLRPPPEPETFQSDAPQPTSEQTR